MPNHCCNILTITSDNINKIKDFYSENLENASEENEMCFSHLSFQKSVPIPKDKEKDWYIWNCENWGTKWNAYDIDIMDSDNEIEYIFQTAWSPPLSWLNSTASKYTDINFQLTYSEPGCDFGGNIQYKNGELFSSEEYSLSERSWEKVNRELLEKIINDYLNDTEYDSDADISDIVDSIYNTYCDEDEYYYNIESFIEEEVTRMINSNVINAVKLDHNDLGKKINNIKI